MSLTATAPAASARRATSTEKVSAEIGAPGPDQALDRRQQRRRLVLGRHRRPAARRNRAHVEHVEAGLDQRQPVGDRPLRVSLRAPSNIESAVTLTIPAASGCSSSRLGSARRQRIRLR